MYQKLQFRRQFLLTRAPIAPLADWKNFQIDGYYLYVHPDLEVNRVTDSTKSIVVIGDFYDWEEPEKGNTDILKDIFSSTYSIQGVISQIKRYAGSYTLLYEDDKATVILPDARAVREVYYCTKGNQIVCGSQPNLIAKFSNPRIESTTDPDLLEFHRNHLWDSRWVGDETYYEGVKHLLPNHYLDINRREVRRYWPNEPIKRVELEEAVSTSCKFLQGVMKAIVHRHSVMMAVTAGTDTRTLLAASKGIQNKIYYFVNNWGLAHDAPDISVPRKIFENIGVPFHVHDVPKDVDDEFRQIFLSNIFLASEHYLPSIYNVFFKNHNEKICILGMGEIGRNFYGKEPRNLNGYRMAYKFGYKESRYVMRQCQEVLAEILPEARMFGINALVLLYWEQRLGNWGAIRNSESYIAIDKVDPFNSYLLNEIFLGVDEKYKNYVETPCVFFRDMIRSMWPELLEWPINPPYTVRDNAAWFLKKVGIFEPLKEIKYQASYVRYLCRGSIGKFSPKF